MLQRTFLVYLTGSTRPAWKMPAPREPEDFAATFEAHFRDMTAEPIEVGVLPDIHERVRRSFSRSGRQYACEYTCHPVNEATDPRRACRVLQIDDGHRHMFRLQPAQDFD